MSSLIRKTVSKKKRRYQKNGFDLDLTYILDNIIAMGYPSENMEGVYRNPMKEVFRFLEQMHKDHYKVYNLCSERWYDISKFHNRVEHFPFDDHNCPSLDLVVKFCKNVKEWLSADEKNVVVVHCKAGKGRTGLMICSYLLFSGAWKNSQDALDFYAAMRTYNKKGVTIPSQIRYVNYFDNVVSNNNSIPDPRPLLLTSVELCPPPKVSNLADIRFSIYVNKQCLYTFKDTPMTKSQKAKKAASAQKGGSFLQEKVSEDEDPLHFECTAPVPLLGDIKVEFYEKEKFGGSDKLFSYWFNTGFVDNTNTLEIKKEHLDKAHKDRVHKIYKENFRVICNFQALDKDVKQIDKIIKERMSQSFKNAPLSTEVLNGSTTFSPTKAKRDPCEVAEDLLQQIIEVVLNHGGVLSNQQEIDAVRESAAFKAFVVATCELQQVDVQELSHEEKLCFWLNTYNLLSVHAGIVQKEALAANTLADRIKLLKNSRYNIGGYGFSLADIEFYVLRLKMTRPEIFDMKALDEIDPRNLCALNKPEPRINFALSYGTKLSPSIRVYHISTVFEELERATRKYMEDYVTISKGEGEVSVSVPKVLEMYSADFTSKPERLVKTMRQYLPKDKEEQLDGKTVYNKEDWSFYFSFKHYNKGSQ